jgi:hypothetical protein
LAGVEIGVDCAIVIAIDGINFGSSDGIADD